ncbi:sensor histidine kinase [Sphingobacterium psychroaquaticum]|uniref:histidine kinase n=1 Tax=Sphingobacterium psychroaquaticum TaxID=561061 RepID=A0A1X7JS89_9SPHI|nr:HAMP domain-containing sensor histidine kinase [Sphingobacterium psychroaquaticum]SMG31256.1 Signal transduction histidine kinase [Sphingobacterium psychroaquaticum]
MKLRHRLSLYAVLVFTVVMLVVAFLIYFSYYAQMVQKEHKSLENKSLLAAIYYLEQDELPVLEHTHIKNQLNKAISRKNIVVFDSLGHKFNGDMTLDGEIPKDFIKLVEQQKNAFFDSPDFFYNGIFYEDNQGDFVVITREPREEFNGQMASLMKVLWIAFFIGLLIIFLSSQYLGYIAYQPIINIVKQIKERDSKNFNEPLKLARSYAEIEDLVTTYNHFVDRIAQTFTIQKNFIDYVSHELRTPITALLGTLEVTSSRPRSIEVHEEAIRQLKQYTSDLQETLDQMMLLSGAKTSFEFREVRVDEIVWQVIENMILYHQAQVEVEILVKDNALLMTEGNDKLLELAINNILENAVKYSDNKPIKVTLSECDGRLIVSVLDQGIGIPQDDLHHIKDNFFRAQNTKGIQGKGIGLSMANIIFSLHNIQLQIHSGKDGTRVDLLF